MLHSLHLPVLVTCVVIVSPIMVWTTRLVEFLPVSLTASVHVIMCLAIVSPSMVWTLSLFCVPSSVPNSFCACDHVLARPAHGTYGWQGECACAAYARAHLRTRCGWIPSSTLQQLRKSIQSVLNPVCLGAWVHVCACLATCMCCISPTCAHLQDAATAQCS